MTGTGKSSLMKLKKFIVKFTRCIKLLHQIGPDPTEDFLSESSKKPALVPKGHVAMVAGKGSETPSRFAVDLKHLKSPQVLKLLKEAEEEYGFHHEGALVVPCEPQELQKILDHNI